MVIIDNESIWAMIGTLIGFIIGVYVGKRIAYGRNIV